MADKQECVCAAVGAEKYMPERERDDDNRGPLRQISRLQNGLEECQESSLSRP